MSTITNVDTTKGTYCRQEASPEPIESKRALELIEFDTTVVDSVGKSDHLCLDETIP
jgi:hypothetical protein